MPKPDLEGLIVVTDDFAALMGLTPSECRKLSLRELCDRAFDLGYDLEVSSRPSLEKVGRLTLTVAEDRPNAD